MTTKSSPTGRASPTRARGGRGGAGWAGVVLGRGGFAWGSVPLCNWFCKVTGFAGTTGVAEAGSDVVLDRTVKIRFDASRDRDMPWEFRPVAHEMDLKIGETGLAFFEAYNPTDRPVAGRARPSRKSERNIIENCPNSMSRWRAPP